mmetsp:Transcript_19384/g.46687  ORF Transcript_19384/g.46687 Transcript_19384/m.46687 type:complete len:188 (-) Transcript_19384:241-804(-)
MSVATCSAEEIAGTKGNSKFPKEYDIAFNPTLVLVFKIYLAFTVVWTAYTWVRAILAMPTILFYPSFIISICTTLLSLAIMYGMCPVSITRESDKLVCKYRLRTVELAVDDIVEIRASNVFACGEICALWKAHGFKFAWGWFTTFERRIFVVSKSLTASCHFCVADEVAFLTDHGAKNVSSMELGNA